MHGRTIELGSLLADAADRQRRLPVVPLLVERDGDYLLLPADDFTLQAGDQLLFASPLAAQRKLELTLRNANELDYVLTGNDHSGSLLGKLLAGARPGAAAIAARVKKFPDTGCYSAGRAVQFAISVKKHTLIYLTNT
jgi:hypothetical protein